MNMISLNGHVSTDGNGFPERPGGVSDQINLSGVLPSFRFVNVPPNSNGSSPPR
jgi:hypothetical protein